MNVLTEYITKYADDQPQNVNDFSHQTVHFRDEMQKNAPLQGTPFLHGKF